MSQQINLFDPGLRPRRQLLGAATLVMATLLLIAGMLAYSEYERARLAAIETARTGTAAQLKELQVTLAKIGGAPARTPDKALHEELARVEAKAKSWQELMGRLGGAGIGNTEGHARFLEALAREHTDGVWLTHVSAGDGNFALHGRVLRPELLSRYIQTLSREEALRGKSIAEMKVSEKVVAAAPEEGANKDGASKDGARAPRGEMRYVEFVLASAPTAVKPQNAPGQAEALR